MKCKVNVTIDTTQNKIIATAGEIDEAHLEKFEKPATPIVP